MPPLAGCRESKQKEKREAGEGGEVHEEGKKGDDDDKAEISKHKKWSEACRDSGQAKLQTQNDMGDAPKIPWVRNFDR